MPKSFDASKRTFEVMFYSGATVPRYDWYRDEEYDLRFEVTDKAVDLSRLNAGAPFLRDHFASTYDQIGVIEEAWLDGGKGYARVRLSEREDVAGIAKDIETGIIRNVSMGAATIEEAVTRDPKTQRKLITATKWLPMEVSAVAIPADSRAQILSADEIPHHLASAARLYIDERIKDLTQSLAVRVEAAVRLSMISKGVL